MARGEGYDVDTPVILAMFQAPRVGLPSLLRLRAMAAIVILIAVQAGTYLWAELPFNDADAMAAWLRGSTGMSFGWESGTGWSVARDVLFRFLTAKLFALTCEPHDAECYLRSFQYMSIAAFAVTHIGLHLLLLALGFSSNRALFGNVLFVFAPPILSAYQAPIHTVGEPLLYVFMVWAVLASVRRWIAAAAIASAFAALCGTVGILTSIPLLFAPDVTTKRKLAVLLPSVVCTVLLAALTRRAPAAEAFPSANLFETVAFLFLTFGVLWAPALSALIARGGNQIDSLGIVGRSGALVLALATVLGVLVGPPPLPLHLFPIFPWVIPLALDAVRNVEFLRGKMHMLFFVLGTLACLYVIQLDPAHFVSAEMLGWVALPAWWWQLLLHVLLTLTVLPAIIGKKSSR